MKRIASLLICATVLWTIPTFAQTDEESDEIPSYVSTWAPDQFVTRWLVCGPFPNSDNRGRDVDYLTTAGGEAQIRPKAGISHSSAADPTGVVRWREASASANGHLNFRQDFEKLSLPHEFVVAYAFCWLRAPQEMDVILKLGSDDGAKLWLNGELVHDTGRVARYEDPGEDMIPARLSAGDNTLLIKVDQGIYDWRTYLKATRAFPLGDGVFLSSTEFGPVLTGASGSASAVLSISNTKNAPAVIDRIGWEESEWLEAGSVSLGELAPRSSEILSLQVRNKPMEASVTSEPVQMDISAYRDGTRIGGTSIDVRITDFLTPVDGAERGTAIRGFEASSDGIVRPCAVHIPEDYKQGEPLPLIIALNPAPTPDSNEPDELWRILDLNPDALLTIYFDYGLAQRADAEGFAVICLNRRPITRWDRLAVRDGLDALAAMQSHFPIDADRVYLFGAGSGGNGVYNLGLQYPDVFAAMALAEGAVPKDLARNALNLPQYIVYGIKLDGGYEDFQIFRDLVELFSSYGCTIKRKEYLGGEEWSDFLSDEWETIFNWFRQHRRVVYPRKVSYSVTQLPGDSAALAPTGAYWVRVKAGKDAYKTPQIDVAVKGNVIDAVTINVGQYTLLLNSELLDLNAPITVRTNGEVSFSGQLAEKEIEDNEAILTINVEHKRPTWPFVAIVGLVALVGLGVVCLRLIKVKRQARQAATEEELPRLTAGFRGIWLIAMKEFRSHLLTERFLWTTLLCLGMVLLSFWLMTNDYQTRLNNYAISLRKPDDLYHGRLFWYDLHADGGTGRPAYIRPTPIVKEPNVMSIFVQGLERRMSRPVYYSLHQEVEFDDVSHTNFLMDIYSKLDLVYIVQIAMSLLALLFVFQSICGEREAGTLRLMLANAVPRDIILLGKWVGGYLGLIIPFLLAMGVGLVALLLTPSIHLSAEHWIRLAWLLVASLIYISTFFTLGILISALTRRTMTAFLAALFAWIVLVLVLPNAGGLLARELKPVESVQQLEVEKDLMKRKMEDEQQKIQRSTYWVYGYGLMHFEIWDDIREEAWRLDADHRRRTRRLGDYTRLLTRLSPAAAYSYAMMDIAGTNIGDELAYHDQLRRYAREQPEEGQSFVWKILFNHQEWNFRYMPKPWRDGVSHAMVDLLLLVLLNVILFLYAYLAFMRYQVT